MLIDFDKITDEEISEIKIEYNLHSHNFLCGHAVGTVSDYAEEAFNKGVKLLGISDHIESSNFRDWGYINKYNFEEKYISQFAIPTEKYKDSLKLLKGGETEFFDDNEDTYKQLKSKLDYLILGQHYFKSGSMESSIFDFCNNQNYAIEFIEEENRGVDSGFFSVLAHPDMVFGWYGGETKELKKHVEKLVVNAASKNMLVEFNANGIRNNSFRYPTDFLVEVCKYNNISVIVSSDCHMPQVMTDNFVKRLMAYLIKNGIKVLTLNEVVKHF